MKQLDKQYEQKVRYLISRGMNKEEAEKSAKGLLLLGF